MPNRSIRDQMQRPARSYGAPMSEKPSNYTDRRKPGVIDEGARRAALAEALKPGPAVATRPRVRGSSPTLPNTGGRQRRASIDKIVDGE